VKRRSLKSGDVRPVAGHLGESAAGLKLAAYGLRQASSGLAMRAWSRDAQDLSLP
jgi:thiamine monophosphate kinase